MLPFSSSPSGQSSRRCFFRASGHFSPARSAPLSSRIGQELYLCFLRCFILFNFHLRETQLSFFIQNELHRRVIGFVKGVPDGFDHLLHLPVPSAIRMCLTAAVMSALPKPLCNSLRSSFLLVLWWSQQTSSFLFRDDHILRFSKDHLRTAYLEYAKELFCSSEYRTAECKIEVQHKRNNRYKIVMKIEQTWHGITYKTTKNGRFLQKL